MASRASGKKSRPRSRRRRTRSAAAIHPVGVGVHAVGGSICLEGRRRPREFRRRPRIRRPRLARSGRRPPNKRRHLARRRRQPGRRRPEPRSRRPGPRNKKRDPRRRAPDPRRGCHDPRLPFDSPTPAETEDERNRGWVRLLRSGHWRCLKTRNASLDPGLKTRGMIAEPPEARLPGLTPGAGLPSSPLQMADTASPERSFKTPCRPSRAEATVARRRALSPAAGLQVALSIMPRVSTRGRKDRPMMRPMLRRSTG